ncbi:SIS domain-containing protein [Cryptosporangium phraense]|uniref:SIS domain-containing protein n=2 Tax=Cryptosporangium phraense TaxID=2593070 RepID=A0A545AG97_9ACTN|nr:SIS domain-containing protein [Cryptosporangium phraense]
MNAAPGALMSAEISEQPTVLSGLLSAADGISSASSAILERSPRFVMLAARGTSDHAALYAKYLVETRLGLPAGLASPSSMTLYGSRPDLRDVLFLGVSQSGASPDLVDSMTVAGECGATTVAVTNNPSSALAAAAEFHVDVRAGAEQAVAATKTYTAELLALYLLLGGSSADALPDAAAATLASGDVARAAARYRFAERLVTTGRGFGYPTAREAALKLMETSYLSAQAFSTADLLHGPLAMIDSGVPVIAVATPDAGGAAVAPVVSQLRSSGADVLVVGEDLPVVRDGVPPELSPVLDILPLQRLAWQVAIDRGENPDRPRGLSKVTETR